MKNFLFDFGIQPVSNRFYRSTETTFESHPFQLEYDDETTLISLKTPFPVDSIRPRVDWLTCFEPEDHLDRMVESIISLPGLTKESVFSGYSFKDDSTLERLRRIGYKNTWRLDPVLDLGIENPLSGVETMQDVITPCMTKKAAENKGLADVVIVRHVLEHAVNLRNFSESIKNLIKPNGYIVWELPDCQRSLECGDCTMLWEEHVHYFTSYSIKRLLHKLGYDIKYFDVVKYPLENSIIVITRIINNFQRLDDFSDNDKFDEISRLLNYPANVSSRVKAVKKKLEYLKSQRVPIAILGAGHLTVTFLSIMGLAELMDFVVDDNPNKNDLFMPISGLRIRDSSHLKVEGIKLCLLGLNPANHKKVIDKNIEYVSSGGKFTSIFPETDLYLEDII